MKRIIKRVFATVCVICILSALVLPCFGATPSATYKITFNLNTFDEWTDDQNNAITGLFVQTENGLFSYAEFIGKTLSLDYYDGVTSVFYFINYSYYEITIGFGQSNPWKWLGQIVIEPCGGVENPGYGFVTPSMFSGAVGTIQFYTYSSDVPTYVAPKPAGPSRLIQYYFSDGSSAPYYYYVDESCLGGWYDVPLIDGYNVIPSQIYVYDYREVDKYRVYLYTYDEVSRFNEGYELGKAEALKDLFTIKEQQYNNGYSDGLNDGLKQNKLTYSQIQEIRSEYNVFTACFDGIFSGILNLWNTVTNGISFGGITVNMVISSMLVIYVVVLIGSAILKL